MKLDPLIPFFAKPGQAVKFGIYIYLYMSKFFLPGMAELLDNDQHFTG